jgi:hypothetical protein
MVHYRRFQADGPVAWPLEGLCRQALETVDASGTSLSQRVEDRVFQLQDQFGGEMMLNRVADLTSAIYGEFCYSEEKGLQALLRLKASTQQLSNITLAEVFDLEERKAPTGSQFIRGLAYWMAIGDHLFFLKTQAMDSDRIHAYLNWLLKERTKTVDPTLPFRLQAEFDRSVGDVGDIQKLRVTGRTIPAVVGVVADGPAREVQTRRRVEDAALRSEQAKPVWEAILGAAKTESLIKALGPGEYITADASLAVRGRRTAESKRQIKELANDIADMSDARVQIEGKDGRLSDGDAILRTRMPFAVPHQGSTLLDFDNVADQLRTVYSRFVQDGKIDA